MEKLNLGQRKFSPLAKISSEFVAHHPNPYINVFIELSEGKNARIVPRLPVWRELDKELRVSGDRIFNKLATPKEALADAQKRGSRILKRDRQIWERVREDRIRQWSAYEPD